MFFLTSLFTAYSQSPSNFSSGNFIQNPTWEGDVSKFKISDGQLQLSDNTADKIGPSYLSTVSDRVRNTSWEFRVKMDFNPTSSNYSKIYLCSTNGNLNEALNGFFVRLGHTNKNVALLSQDGTKTTVLFQGESKRLDMSSVSVKIKVTLDKQGIFSIYSQLEGESDFVFEGSKQVTEFPESNYFGVVCVYTKTRNEHFVFDNFAVAKIDEDDSLPEELKEVPAFGDIIFSEIMAKPVGDVPEYVEFYNHSDKTFSLKNWQFYYGDKPYTLPEAEIKPNAYFVLCKPGSVSYFSDQVKAIGVSSFPTLANTGKLLRLDDNNGTLVHWFEYSEKMYGSDEKKTTGGWSLECIDLENKSNSETNWSGSLVEGGTPGMPNSMQAINPDVEYAHIISVTKLQEDTLLIKFSKPLDLKTLSDKQSYDIRSTGYDIDFLSFNYPQGTELKLHLNKMPDKGEIIDLFFPGLLDLSGHVLDDEQFVSIGSGYEAEPLDVVINELLPNPLADSNEYVELYNRSNKAIDLSFLSIASRKNTDGTLNKAYPLASGLSLLYPKQYLLITKSMEKVTNFYSCPIDVFAVELSVMPTITNTLGCIVLINNQTNVIVDEFSYTEKMHDASILDKKGVALERIDVDGPTNSESNWTSASSFVGYGTPGYANSQKRIIAGLESLKPAVNVVTIDADNYQINYHFFDHGNRCRIMVFNTLGKLVKTIANNELLGTEGSISWNGKADGGQKLQSGIYFIRMEVVSSNGETARYGLKCLVEN